MTQGQAKALALALVVVIILAASHLATYQIAKLNDEVERTKQAMRDLEIKVNQVKIAKKVVSQ